MSRENSDLNGAERICPSCQHSAPVATFVSGVCGRCKESLKKQHGHILKPGFRETPVTLNKKFKPAPHFEDSDTMLNVMAAEETMPEEEIESHGSILERYCQENGFNHAVGMMALASAANLLGAEDHLPDLARVMEMFKRGLRIVRGTRNLRERADRLEFFILALQWHGELPDGVTNDAELARYLKITKANANKYKNQFRDIIAEGMNILPTVRGERDEAARRKFTVLRHQKSKAK